MKKLTAVLASLLLLIATNASAVTITGNLSGTLDIVGLSKVQINVASQTIDFNDPTTFYVVAGSGDFSGLAGQVGSTHDVSSSADFTNFLSVGGFTFDITTATFGSSAAGDYVIGNGIAYFNGESAYAYWSLTNQGGQTSWSATVPEPATLAILGLGLLGFGVARRRKA